MEKKYAFRARMENLFRSSDRDMKMKKKPGECDLGANWSVESVSSHILAERAADDLQTFLKKSMHAVSGEKKIILDISENGKCEFGCSYNISDEKIYICGDTPRGLLFGVIHLEDMMRMRRAPFVRYGSFRYEYLVRMRSTHSGSALDDFSDRQLNAILHAGFTAIDVFVCGINRTTQGYCDLNDLIKRASSYGLDVVFYSYLSCYVHPDDPGAEEFADRVYGELFRACPGAKAIHLVGESLEFPSRDRSTVQKSQIEDGNDDGLQPAQQPTGYYPNSDYPAYLKLVRDAIHRADPGVEVIFNTYNWGWAPEEPRRKFLQQMPENISLQVTYDIFKEEKRHGLVCPVMDYSIYAAEPSFYFTSEVKAAYDSGIRNIRVTSNMAGLTWDFGCAPFAPVPFRWIKRMEILRDYLQKYTVNSFYDSHHYGWTPNFCNDLVKAIFSSEPPDPEKFLLQTAVRDYGSKAARTVVNVWKKWSSAMDHYVASNEDQYGPWRVGPAYPFVFQVTISRTMDDKIVRFPMTKRSYRAGCIVKAMYHPYENDAQSPGPLRLPVEIRELGKMEKLWDKALSELEKSLSLMDGAYRKNGEMLYNTGKFIRNMIRTTLGIKKFYRANMRLQNFSSRPAMLSELEIIVKLLEAEKANVLDTIPLVEKDSRLGWEPRMDYVCDTEHLQWKLRQLAIAFEEVEAYRKMINLK